MNTTYEFSFFTAVLSAHPVVQITLAILILMSIWSWAIILYKWRQLSQSMRNDLLFRKTFDESGNLPKVFEESILLKNKSPKAKIFNSAYHVWSASRSSSEGGSKNLSKELSKLIQQEVGLLDDYLIFLASIGSSGPFIGLFGTVWGIMNAFHKIGVTGSAQLSVVAPGISEALIATAIGLFAAIPASIAYNQFSAKVSKIEDDLNDYSEEVLERLSS